MYIKGNKNHPEDLNSCYFRNFSLQARKKVTNSQSKSLVSRCQVIHQHPSDCCQNQKTNLHSLPSSQDSKKGFGLQNWVIFNISTSVIYGLVN